MFEWNPLEYDYQSFQLLALLKLSMTFGQDYVEVFDYNVNTDGANLFCREYITDSVNKAMRYAITNVAAEVGSILLNDKPQEAVVNES
jgi:hypothetical protein